MKAARMIGNYAENRIHDLGISTEEINGLLNLSDQETEAFFKGRLLLTYDQLTRLAQRIDVTTLDLIKGNEEEYTSSVVHCMNPFDNEQNREKILDIIDDYMDIQDSLLASVSEGKKDSCMVCGYDMFLSDDSDSKALNQYILRKYKNQITIYNREELVKSIKSGQVKKIERRAFSHSL